MLKFLKKIIKKIKNLFSHHHCECYEGLSCDCDCGCDHEKENVHFRKIIEDL